MQEPIRAKLEKYNAKLGALSSSLADGSFYLKKAEEAHTSGMRQVWYAIAGFMVFMIFTAVTNSFIFIILGFSILGIGFMYGYDENAGLKKMGSIRSNILIINSEITAIQTSIKYINDAIKAEENLDYQSAIALFDQVGLSSEAKRIRMKMQKEGKVKVDQTVVHGDYVDDRDTIVKDSVINRSNVGAGSDDKIAKLEKIAEMKDKGIIDDDEFKQMKKEILGK